MTRFKKECIKRGFDYAEKYAWLPYEVQKGIVLEDIIFNAETCEIVSIYNVMVCKCRVNKDFSVIDLEV